MNTKYDMTIIILLEKGRDYKDKNIHSVIILYRIYMFMCIVRRYLKKKVCQKVKFYDGRNSLKVKLKSKLTLISCIF